MYQYDDPSAVSSLPVPAAAGTPGFFSDGNPSAGAQPTILRSDFMNMLMMELVNLVTGAGLTTSKTNYTQVRSAIQLMIATGQQAIIFTGVAFAAGVANGNAVKWNAAANNYALAQADGTSDDLAVGFADVTNGRVFFKGLVPGLFTGLTPGARYYLDPATAGAITLTKPTDAVNVGIAESATTLFADFGPLPANTVTFNRVINNLGLAASVNANALTVALKGANGADPTGTNLVSVGIRNATASNGTYNLRQIAAAQSIVVPSGTTLGTVSGQPARIWVAEIDNAGTAELALFVSLVGAPPNFNIAPIVESALISTTAIAGGNTAGVWYSTTARANVPFTVIGYLNVTEAAAGTWAAAPAMIEINPVHRPGDELQEVSSASGQLFTSMGFFPLNDTPPQLAGGAQIFTASLAPVFAGNLLEADSFLNATVANSNEPIIAALFQDAGANTIGCGMTWYVGSNKMQPLEAHYSGLAGTTASTTFQVRMGAQTQTSYVNGEAATRRFGGTLFSYLSVKEIMV